jgi:anti-anti-sigma factor
MGDYQTIDVDQIGTVSVVSFRVEKLVDQDLIVELSNELNRLADVEKPAHLLVSFAGVRLLASAALAAVLSLVKRVKTNDGDLKLCAMSPMVYKVFAITELDKLLDIREDEAAGLQAFSD